MTKKSFLLVLTIVIAILLIPLIAMQFDTGVDWDIRDFSIMGVLLMGTGITCVYIVNKVKSMRARIILCAIVVLALLLIWAELAVGLFGTPFAGN